MASFLADFSNFYGDNSLNEDGLNLDDYLLKYDPSEYRNPSVTADVMVFRYYKELQSVEDDLSILMIKRKNHPCIGEWALPGGFCEIGEDLDAAARRELWEETGLKDIPIKQLRTWGEVWRDPRDRIITTAYAAVVDESVHEIKAGDDAAEALWFDIEFSKTASAIEYFDNKELLKSTYIIKLYNKEKDIRLEAKVALFENLYGIFKQTVYKVEENKGIAFDHPRFIVDGLLAIKDILRHSR